MSWNRKRESGYFGFTVAIGLVFLSEVAMFALSSEPQHSSALAPEIEAEGKAEDRGLTFQWRVNEQESEIQIISIVITKNDAILQTARTKETTGTYFITPYSEGKFTLHIQAITRGDLKREKTVVVETKGNQPLPCPSWPSCHLLHRTGTPYPQPVQV